MYFILVTNIFKHNSLSPVTATSDPKSKMRRMNKYYRAMASLLGILKWELQFTIVESLLQFQSGRVPSSLLPANLQHSALPALLLTYVGLLVLVLPLLATAAVHF